MYNWQYVLMSDISKLFYHRASSAVQHWDSIWEIPLLIACEILQLHPRIFYELLTKRFRTIYLMRVQRALSFPSNCACVALLQEYRPTRLIITFAVPAGHAARTQLLANLEIWRWKTVDVNCSCENGDVFAVNEDFQDKNMEIVKSSFELS